MIGLGHRRARAGSTAAGPSLEGLLRHPTPLLHPQDLRLAARQIGAQLGGRGPVLREVGEDGEARVVVGEGIAGQLYAPDALKGSERHRQADAPRTKRARSIRSISNVLTYFTPISTQAFGIFINRGEFATFSWVTTV